MVLTYFSYWVRMDMTMVKVATSSQTTRSSLLAVKMSFLSSPLRSKDECLSLGENCNSSWVYPGDHMKEKAGRSIYRAVLY